MNTYTPTYNGSTAAARLLVVEDDDATRDALVEGLRLYGNEVSAAADCSAARRVLRKQQLDAVLLDVNLPDDSGYDLLREIRMAPPDTDGVSPDVAVLMLSGRGDEPDRVRGFDLGCDDYVIKPYSFSELRGRLAAVLRRSRDVHTHERQWIGELMIDHRERRVELAGKPVSLTGKEWGLLTALASDATRVFTREQLLRTVWGYRSNGSTRTLDAHACRLRSKLSHGSRRYVINMWGIGYRLHDPAPCARTAVSS
ncbi:MAG: response regulator transcription factor [Thermoleophilia bacterium]|nr:response regulator transcription factor [Thermoleophilia bacterium]